MIVVHHYTIYHSANSYIGTKLLREGLSRLPFARLERRPIFIPRARGVLVSEMLGGRENRRIGSYNREDCARWAKRYSIPLNYPDAAVFAERAARWASFPFDREELPARAYYAAAPDDRDRLDDALFGAAWVAGLDVNEESTVAWAAERAGLDPGRLLDEARGDSAGTLARAAVEAFDAAECPGVPTAVVQGERFLGKDRVDWALDRCRTVGVTEDGATRG
jgi:2-hydroxychromene-2-carboxylate isomerase